MKAIEIAGRAIGPDFPPLVIAEIGINHEGSFQKAVRMVDDAAAAGCECAKFQCHVIEDEMIPNDVVPGNARESIWNIMRRCALSEEEEWRSSGTWKQKGMMYLSTPFSRAAAVRLERMRVSAYKIGSGECNNYPLISHIARLRQARDSEHRHERPGQRRPGCRNSPPGKRAIRPAALHVHVPHALR